MKLFLDENLSTQHAVELRSNGYDACAAVEVGLSGAPDELRDRRWTEQRIRHAIQRALSLLENTDLAGCLAVVDENKGLSGDSSMPAPAGRQETCPLRFVALGLVAEPDQGSGAETRASAPLSDD